ncbi:MAG TPA: hypothetical protein VIJ35_11965 [Bradyrhizobium sp.]
MPAPSNFNTSAQEQGAVAAKAHRRLCAVVLLLFVVAATLSAIRKDVTRGFDEVAHASYVAHLQHSGEAWPRFEDMRMLDPSSFEFTSEGNYLDHPSPYYVLLARIGPSLEGHPGAILFDRLFNVLLGAIGLAALMAVGLVAKLPRLPLYAYIVPIAAIPVLAPLAGAINNDSAAFAGGGIATLAALQLLSTGSRAWLLAALGGVILASWAKFTALLLVGGLVGGVLLWLLWRGGLPSRWVGLIAIAALLAVAPYLALFAQYGSPTPRTPGQIAMIKSGALAVGWDSAERMTPASYAAHFVSEFVLEWMPVLKPRNALNYAALTIPITTALCAFAGFLVAVRRIAHEKAGSLDIVVVAGMLAFAGTFFIHGVFSYQLHTEFGWQTTAYPRYYLPLAAIVPLAGLSLLDAIKQPAARTALLVFLIAGPLVFRLSGAPLG